MKKWYDEALFYEIYPTSFYDSNGDGIGDLKGIEDKLPYIKDAGFNALWINPFFKSPFKDGGYDIADYLQVDERFGTNDDLKSLIDHVHQMKMHVIIDLVPGHTSEMHPYFVESASSKKTPYDDLYIWNASVWDYERPYILVSGRYDRNASYMVNFFSHQPALNYGFKEITHPQWQMSYLDERTFQARNLMVEVMRFYLAMGIDGFRVDMADSLVKNDDDKEATIYVWNQIFPQIKKEYPDVFLVSEWSNPSRSFRAGFNADFVLDHHDNFSHYLARMTDNEEKSLLKGGNLINFKTDLLKRVQQAKLNNGYLACISGNHDSIRIGSFLNDEEMKLFYMILFTLPGIPFVYYGDEIGMKHVMMESKDGGYQRTGSRLMMKWDNTTLHGFSTNPHTYLPFDPGKENVADELKSSRSLLNFVKKMTSFRSKNPQLRENEISFIENQNDLLIFKRNDYIIIINQYEEAKDLDIKFEDYLIATSENPLNNHQINAKTGLIIAKNKLILK